MAEIKRNLEFGYLDSEMQHRIQLESDPVKFRELLVSALTSRLPAALKEALSLAVGVLGEQKTRFLLRMPFAKRKRSALTFAVEEADVQISEALVSSSLVALDECDDSGDTPLCITASLVSCVRMCLSSF